MDLAAEPDKRIRPSGGGGTEPPGGFGKRLMSVLRAVYHMLRRGLCRKRLMMDLHLLLGRGKLAGKALRNLVAAANHPHGAHHHHRHLVAARAGAGAPNGASGAASSSASAADLPFAPNPRDVEFSCETTPSYSYAGPVRALFPFRIRGRGGSAARGCDGLDFAQVARALEMMSAAEDAAAAGAAGGAGGETPLPASAAGATPSPMLALSLGRSPAGARQLRVTDSPFPLEPEGVDERANSNFDAFINKFYENLRLQAANATPDNCVRRRG